jgi:hypothetical protein
MRSAKSTSCCGKRRCCFRRCSIGSPIACRSSRASSCSRLGRCKSEETRQHLQDAHRRVLSVATVQQQLQASGWGDRIEVGPYLSKLCDILGKSIIDHRGPHSLLVQAAAAANYLVSLTSRRGVTWRRITTAHDVIGPGADDQPRGSAWPGSDLGQAAVDQQGQHLAFRIDREIRVRCSG